MSAGTAPELDPGSRIRPREAVQAQGQPHTAVPEAIAETPVTRWIPFPRGNAPWSCAGPTLESTSFGSPERGVCKYESTKSREL